MMLPPDRFSAAERIVAHDGPHAFEAVVPPIVQTSLFTFATVSDMVETYAGRRSRDVYSRTTNPTVSLFEAKMAALEGGEEAIGFPSGMAAISGSVLAFVAPGDRIRHVDFGEGRVNQVTGEGAKRVAHVTFEAAGPKKLLIKIAPIEKL